MSHRPSYRTSHAIWHSVTAGKTHGGGTGGDDDHERDTDRDPRTAVRTAANKPDGNTHARHTRHSRQTRRRPTRRLEQQRHPHIPTLRHRRDGILPTVAAALSVRGATLTGTAARADQPPALHPLVQDFLDTLTSAQRDRATGRCAEALLISRQITLADEARSRRAARKPMTNGEARRALKQAKLTTRHIREDGDPLHGSFATPCRACTALSDHFGVRIVDPSAPTG